MDPGVVVPDISPTPGPPIPRTTLMTPYASLVIAQLQSDVENGTVTGKWGTSSRTCAWPRERSGVASWHSSKRSGVSQAEDGAFARGEEK